MSTVEILATAVGITTLLAAFFAVVRVSLNLQSVALAQISGLRTDLELQKVRAVDAAGLASALDRVLLAFNQRMDGVELSLKETSRDLTTLNIAVAVLNDREHVTTDYSAAARRSIDALRG